MLLLQLDETSAIPKYRQIMTQIQQKIATHALRAGDKLPSTRRLAEKLGSHRSTVALAYQELWSLGYLDLHPGSCPRVRQRMRAAAAVSRSEDTLIDWSVTASAASNAILANFQHFHPETGQTIHAGAINFSSLDMDRRLAPQDSFRTCLNRAVRKHGHALFGYGERAGFHPLREYIARRLHSHGIAISADEIMLTNGSQQGIDMVLRMIAAPGARIAVESPTYAQVLPLLRFQGLQPIEIPIRRDGMDLDTLQDAIAVQKPSLIYTMPNFQNPTGVSTSQAHRERLLALCEAHRIPILEDGFEEEMKYFGKAVLPIKSMDSHNLVIYCGTFSKVLFPGIRIGWIAAAKECIARLIAIRRFSELSTNIILQAALHEFCQVGYYDRHISKMHRVYRKRMQTVLRGLRAQIDPHWAEWQEPVGGYLIWLKLKPIFAAATDWQALFDKYQVYAAHGHYFFNSHSADTFLRLSISTTSETEIVAGVQRLSALLKYAHSGGHT